MKSLVIHQLHALSDNYVYLLQDPESGKTAVVDPSLASPVLKCLKEYKLSLDYVLCTHHHFDHTGGNLELKKATGCEVVGALKDQDRIAGIDIALKEGERFLLGSTEAQILEIDGHTVGHIAYWFPTCEALFCGDTLFSLGCGRLFEGSPGQMWESLKKLKALPPSTKIYCGHEYTQNNAQFALTIEPDNLALQSKSSQVQNLRKQGMSTIPAILSEELECNPFLRANSPELKSALNLTTASDVDVFAEVRSRKDNF